MKRKMSQAIDSCSCGDSNGNGNGKCPFTASTPSLLLSRKRLRNMRVSSNDLPRKHNGPGNKTATGSAKFVFDLELADEVEVSQHKKRRVVFKSEQSAENCAAGNRFEAIDKDVGSEDAQVADHRESHEGIAAAAAASHSMNSDSEQTSFNDGSTDKHSLKQSTSKSPSFASGQQGRHSTCEDRLSELVDYCKEYGHCNVPQNYSENAKLGRWVANQRSQYRLRQEGKTSSITPSRIQELESLGFEWGSRCATWEDRLSELADYRKIHGHCNVPARYSNGNSKLGNWGANQKKQYRLRQEGKTSSITPSRIQELESLGFEWGSRCATWEDRLSELADYRKIHGHCNVPRNYSENTKLGNWVTTQRYQYKLLAEGKKSQMTNFCIQQLERLGFEWDIYGAVWEDRLNELDDYCQSHGHCNVPKNYSENSKLANWVTTQRMQYRLHEEGRTSFMTTFRIQKLERLGFEWDSHDTTWEDRLSELADYRKIHGHCNVPENYSENSKLGRWVKNQRTQYRLYREGKPSNIPPFRIQELESLGFGWKPFIGRGKATPKKPSLDKDATRVCKRVAVTPMLHSLKKTSAVETSTAIKSTSLSNPKNPTGLAKSSSTSSRVEPEEIERVEAGDARFDETYLDGSPSKLAVEPSLYSDRQAAKSMSPDKSAPADDSVQASTRDSTCHTPHTKVPWPAHKQKSLNSFSHALSIAAPPESEAFADAKKLANSRQGAESQLETAPSKEIIMANPVVAESLQQRHNLFAHALLLGDGSTGNGVQATPDKPAKAAPYMQQTPPDEVFQSDKVLNEVELELNWLGEESMYCLSFPEFQFDFIYEYASPSLKVELRKLSRDDQSEADKLKHIVRMHDWLVSRRFDSVRNYIRKMLGQGFRRQRMRTVIAELRLLRRQQSERHFPAMILERSERDGAGECYGFDCD